MPRVRSKLGLAARTYESRLRDANPDVKTPAVPLPPAPLVRPFGGAPLGRRVADLHRMRSGHHSIPRASLTLIWLALLAPVLTPWASLRAQTEPELLALPRVAVSADVPLVKIGEHRMRVARYAPAAVAVGDFIYIVAGQTGTDDIIASIERFDLRTNTSEHFADLQLGRIYHGAVAIGGKIYVLGGSVSGRSFVVRHEVINGVTPDDSVETVDLASRSVGPGPRMPAPRSQFACEAHDGRIYLFGGKTEGRNSRYAITNTVAVLDVATGKWSVATPMPTPRQPAAAVVDGGFFIVAGGFNGTRALDVVEVYDPRRDAWGTLPPLVTPRSAHSIVFMGEHLFLFGDYGAPDELLAYNLRSKRSEVFTLGYTPERHTAAVRYGDKIYVIGGKQHRDSQPSDLIQVFAAVSSARRTGQD